MFSVISRTPSGTVLFEWSAEYLVHRAHDIYLLQKSLRLTGQTHTGSVTMPAREVLAAAET